MQALKIIAPCTLAAIGYGGGLALVFRTGLGRRTAALAAAGVGPLPRRG